MDHEQKFQMLGKFVTTFFPRTYLVALVIVDAFQIIDKKTLSAMWPASGNRCFAQAAVRLQKKPPSKFQIVFGMRLSLSAGFCPLTSMSPIGRKAARLQSYCPRSLGAKECASY